MTAAEVRAPEEEGQRGGFGSLGSLLLTLALGWAGALALAPVNDNSFLTHLATGRVILDRGSVPTEDPYTFTSLGEDWTVQSWLASVAYAGAERAGGIDGVRLLIVGVFLAAAVALWFLSAGATSVFTRAGLMAAALLVATDVWSERPYMVGFIGLALVWLALDARLPAWLLVPYLWVWTNVHGSFPLAILLVATVLVGTLIDRKGTRSRGSVAVEMRVLAAVAVGSSAGVLSPLGLRALTFPVRSLADRDSFDQILEWRAPAFTSLSEQLFLVLALLAVAAVVASQRWRHLLPLLVFFAAALFARRNVVMALPVVVAVLAATAPTVGTLKTWTRPRGGALLVSCGAFLIVALIATGLRDRPALALGGYPASALAFVDHRPPNPTVTQDFAGNLLEVLDGPTGAVFVDDRVDMFPSRVLDDYQALMDVDMAWDDVLARYDVSVVVWSAAHPLSSVLRADGHWKVVYADTGWVVAERR